MVFHQLTVSAALAIAALAGIQSTAYAATLSPVAQVDTQQPMQQPDMPLVNQAGQTFFSHPPILGRVNASQKGAYTQSSYEFTLTVPQDAGQPLKAVKIVQDPNMQTIRFDTSASSAFSGNDYAASSQIPLSSIGGNQPENPGEITVVFDQPVQPGGTVTVSVQTNANPSFGGPYEFGVTAYPQGDNSLGQFLGYRRINFYGSAN